MVSTSLPQVFVQSSVGLPCYPERIPLPPPALRASAITVPVQGYFLLDACCMTTYKYPKNKTQLDATYYFIVLLIGSTCFGHYYAHHQELATVMLITTLVVSFLVCCRLEVGCGKAGIVSGLQAKSLQPGLLQPYRTQPPTYSKPRTKRPMW